jgi:hypothetical protein
MRPARITMKTNFSPLLLCAACLVSVQPVHADTLTLLGGRTVHGTLLQTNDFNVVMLTHLGVLNYARAIIGEIKIERVEAGDLQGASRLPDFRNLMVLLASQPWASNLKQIPATVIDAGILRKVPYVSFRCGEDYEVNVYGDLDHPAGIEAGVYRTLLEDSGAKRNCLKFVGDVLGQASDKEIVQGLNLTHDLKTREGLTFEITPPSAPDSYMGWWVSVYSEEKLNLARASDRELDQISVAKSDVAKVGAGGQEAGGWRAEDLNLARPSETTFSFTTKSGLAISNALVKPYKPGVSLIWHDRTGAGVVQLADLPEDLRARFGYDPAAAAGANAREQERTAREAQQAQAEIQAAKAAQASRVQSTTPDYSSPTYFGGSAGGGRVYVQGYTRRDGTYVAPYTRSSPRR